MHALLQTLQLPTPSPHRSIAATTAAALVLAATCGLLAAPAAHAAPITVGPDAARLAAIPNGNAVWANGHRWLNPLRDTLRGSSLAAQNAFGAALAAAGDTWTAALCAADTDGDGFTNGEELGDPGCVWTPGATPARTTDVSHPGLWSSVPTTTAYASGRAQTYNPAACARPSGSLPDRDAEGASLTASVPLPTGLSGVSREAELAQVLEADADAGYYADTHPQGGCPHQHAGLEMWHAAATWPGGAVPAAGSNVTVPAGKRVLVTSCSLPDAGFATVTVEAGAELVFDDAPVHLRMKAMFVYGGVYAGSRVCPVKSPITITFAASRAEAAVYGNGLNVLDGARVELFGWTQERTWTRLKTTANIGAVAIVTLHATTWAAGDEVVLVTSIWKDHDTDQNEVRRVVARDASNASVLLLDRPLRFRHYAGHEYQSEVALLTRTILLRGSPTAAAAAEAYGGHTWAVGPNATYRMVGVRAERMGQRNVMARYPFHFHMMYGGGAGNYVQQCACVHSYFRCYTIHGTNHTRLRKNVAFNSTGHTYYLEDGGEMFNTIEYNIAAKVNIVGEPAGGGAQSGASFTEDAIAILPADHTASGFYLSNAHNWIRGNAASGGWSGYAFPVFDTTLKLSAGLGLRPKEMQLLEFNGNTVHSAGQYWDDAGCIYAGGRLWYENGIGKYTNGRVSHPTMKYNTTSTPGWQVLNNTRAWLCQKGYSSWGERVDLINFECHDCTRAAVLFGSSSVQNALVNSVSENRPADMVGVGRQAFQFYDTWVQTMLVNVTLRNVYVQPSESPWQRNGGIVDLTHSDIFKPWGISATRNLRFENVDRSVIFRRWVRETGASRMFNVMDWDGSVVNHGSCLGHIIGSDIPWWNAYPDCYFEAEWRTWICPRLPGREVVGIDMELPGLQEELDIRTGPNDELTQAQRDQLYIGHISYFGSQSAKKLIITRNHHLATGLSGTAWYMYVDKGMPETIKIDPQNFPRGAYILLCIDYPSDSSVVSITTERRWGDARRMALKAVGTREEVLNGNGTQYFKSGRHLYLKISDMYSAYPNAFSRNKVDIYSVQETDSFITVAMSCPSKTGALCLAPTAPSPPADLAVPLTTCESEANLTAGSLCPAETDTTSTQFPTTACPNMALWQCQQPSVLPTYCRRSCLPDCQRLAPYPYTCSADRGCAAADKPAPVRDWCASLTSTAELQVSSDPCAMAWCNATANATKRVMMPDYTPCFAEDAGGAVLGAVCRSGVGACKGTTQAGQPVQVQHLGASPTAAIEVAVTIFSGSIASVTAHYRYAHEAQGMSGASLPSSRSGAMTLVNEAAKTETSNYTGFYRLALPAGAGRVGGNVTIVVVTSAHGTRTAVFSDWNKRANINPVVEVAAGTPAAGTFEVTAGPLDFVSAASLLVLDPSAKAVVSTVPVSGVTFLAQGDTIRFALSGSSVPALASGQAIGVKLTLTSGATVQASLPCAGRAEGASCWTAVADIRPPLTTCAVQMTANDVQQWWVQVAPVQTYPVVVDVVLMQEGQNRTFPKVSWGYVFQGGPARSMLTADSQLVANLADGRYEVYRVRSSPLPLAGMALECVRGTVADPEAAALAHVPRPAAAGACAANRCVAGPFSGGSPALPSATGANPATSSAASRTWIDGHLIIGLLLGTILYLTCSRFDHVFF